MKNGNGGIDNGYMVAAMIVAYYQDERNGWLGLFKLSNLLLYFAIEENI